jgi:hypothetical protein
MSGVALPRRSDLQQAIAWVLVAERTTALVAPGASDGAYGAALLVVGLWLAWPKPGRRRSVATLTLTPVLAALLAVAGVAWRHAWARLALTPAWLADWGPWLLLVAVLLIDPGPVARIARLTRIEVVKLARSRLLRLAALACLAATLLTGWRHEPLPNETGWSAAAAMLGAGFAVAQVFVLVAGATAIAGEASQGTLKMILPHAYGRSDWVLAKALSLFLSALLLALVVAGAAVAFTLATGSLGDVVLRAEGFGGEPLVTVHATADVMRSHLTDTILAQTLALLTTGALGLVVSCCLTNVVGALCTAFLLFAALKLGDLVLALDQNTLRSLFPWAPERLRELTTKIGQGLSEGWDERLPAVSLLLCTASAALFLLVGVRAFARRDLHV